MAQLTYPFDDQTQPGRILRRYLAAIEDVADIGPDVLAMIQQMLGSTAGVPNDGTNIAHYDEVVKRFRFGGYVSGVPTDEQRTTAKNARSELQSIAGKFAANTAVTDVANAMAQVVAQFR